MGSGPSFLTHTEHDEFLKPGRFIDRSLVDSDTASGRQAISNTRGLTQYLSEYIKQLERREGQWLDLLCIRVRPDDGMSWSAEAVSDILNDKLGHYTQWRLSGLTNAELLPAIARLIGVRTFLRLAIQHRLTRSFFTLRPWLAPIIIAVVIVASVVGKMLETAIKSHTTGSVALQSLLTDGFFIGCTALAVVIALGLQQITAFFTTHTRGASIETFRKELDAKRASSEYRQFVEDLARHLAGWPFPRAVVVDNFEALQAKDPTTAEVMLRYFQGYIAEARGSEFWTIFEHVDGDKFTNRLVDGRVPGQMPRTTTFTQAPLTHEEKRKLARILQRDEDEAIACQVVKCVTYGDEEGAKRWRTIFAGFRSPEQSRPKRYDLLDLLYLMSLTAEGGEYFFSEHDLVNDFAVATVQRAGVLRQFLPGTKLFLNEFREMQDQIARRFGAALVYTDDKKSYRVSLEAAEALTLRRIPTADLPPAALGHLFWALFWFDRHAQASREAFWMRKLAHHARGMDVSLYEGAEAEAISNRAVDLLAFTADGCLRTGVFDKVHGLLRKAVDLLRSEGMPTDARRQNKLLAICWDAYWILGDAELLILASELYEDATSAEERPATALERLFLETVPLRGKGGAVLRAIAGRLSGGAADIGAMVMDHAAARSAWLALTVYPFIREVGTPTLLSASIESMRSLLDMGQRIWDRLATTRTAADGITLLSALWATALLASRLRSAPVLKKLIALAADAVLVAAELRGEGRTTRTTVRQIDFPLAAMARELCAVAIAAITVAHKQVSSHEKIEGLSKSDLNQVAGIVAEINRILGTTLSAIESSEDLCSPGFIAEIDRLLLGCEIVWHTFGLTQLRNAVSIRRAQFNVLCLEETQPGNATRSRRAIDAARSLDDRNGTGLMANLVVAHGLRDEPALAEWFLRRAGQIALEGHFGRAVRREMAFVVVMHSRGTNLGAFVNAVLHDGDEESDDLSHIFRGDDAKQVPGTALRLLEESRDPTMPGLEARCQQAVRMQLPLLPNGVRREIESMLDVGTLRNELTSNAAGQPNEILNSWSDRQDLWSYAWMLDVLLAKGYATTDVNERARATLNHKPEEDTFNAYLLLALSLAEQQPGSSAAIAYLKGGIHRWEHLLPPEINIRVFGILESGDSANRESYRESKVYWQFVALQVKQLHQLPALLDAGRFFDVFQDYCGSMIEWGLPIDKSSLASLGLDDLGLSAEAWDGAAVKWLERGGMVPSPWADNQRARLPSAAFLLLGRLVFAPPLEHDPRFAAVRERFNEDAYQALPDLLKLVLALPGLPAAFKDLVVNFNGRFQLHAARGA